MRMLARRIPVTRDMAVSSEWAVPDGYVSSSGDGLILAHGAGNDMTHPFVSFVHRRLAEAGLLTVKFNFPYKELGRKAPDRPEVLQQTWRAVIDAVRAEPALAPGRLFLGGKSMGGRAASLLAAGEKVCDGLVFLGYPLHPAGQPQRLRTEHWPDIRCPALFVEGTRDPLCDLDALHAELVKFGAPTRFHEIPGADHSFKLPAAAGRSSEAVWTEIVDAVRDWLRNAPGSGQRSGPRASQA